MHWDFEMIVTGFECWSYVLYPKPYPARTCWWHGRCHRSSYHTLFKCKPPPSHQPSASTYNNSRCSICPPLSSSEKLYDTFLRQLTDPHIINMGMFLSPTSRQIQHIARTNCHSNWPTQMRELSRMLVRLVRVPDSARHLDLGIV